MSGLLRETTRHRFNRSYIGIYVPRRLTGMYASSSTHHLDAIWVANSGVNNHVTNSMVVDIGVWILLYQQSQTQSHQPVHLTLPPAPSLDLTVSYYTKFAPLPIPPSIHIGPLSNYTLSPNVPILNPASSLPHSHFPPLSHIEPSLPLIIRAKAGITKPKALTVTKHMLCHLRWIL